MSLVISDWANGIKSQSLGGYSFFFFFLGRFWQSLLFLLILSPGVKSSCKHLPSSSVWGSTKVHLLTIFFDAIHPSLPQLSSGCLSNHPVPKSSSFILCMCPKQQSCTSWILSSTLRTLTSILMLSFLNLSLHVTLLCKDSSSQTPVGIEPAVSYPCFCTIQRCGAHLESQCQWRMLIISNI